MTTKEVEIPPPQRWQWAAGRVGPRFRTVIAFTMAAIAIASASVAFYSSKWASLAADSEGAALQQRAERDRVEQRINIEIAEDTRLWTVYQAHWEAAAALQAEAAQLRASNQHRAELLDLAYQGHQAGMTALGPLFQGSRPEVDESGELVLDTDAERRNLEAADSSLAVLDPEGKQLEAQDRYARALVLVVLIVSFIAALFFMTVAQVYARFAPIMAGVGIGLALATATQIALVDPDVTPWLALSGAGAMGLTLLQVLGTRLPAPYSQWFGTGTEEEGAEAAGASIEAGDRSRMIHERGTPGAPLVDPDEARDRPSKILLVTIAALTLVGASLGYLQIETARAAEDHGVTAQHHALMALSSQIEGSTLAEAAIFAHVRRIEAEVAAANVRQQRLYWQWVGDTPRAGDLDAELDAREREAEAARSADPISGDIGPVDYAAYPPVGDPTFPARFRVGFDETAYMHAAMQDAANDEAARMTGRDRSYTFSIAVLAVVLYLLGLALVLRARGLRVTFVTASAVLIAIAAWVVEPVASEQLFEGAPSEMVAMDAAEAYAEGVVGSAAATNETQRRAAIDRLQVAVQARPGFEQAYIALAQATLVAGSPQSGSSISINDPETVERTVDLLRRAGEHDAASAETELDLGFLLYRKAIDVQPVDQAAIAESIDISRGSIDRMELGEDDLRVLAQMNIAVARLAAGREDNALAAYDAAFATMDAANDGSSSADEVWREGEVAGALTDLDNLASHQPTLVEPVRRAKDYVVGHVWPSSAAEKVMVTNLEINSEFPSMLWWQAEAKPSAGFDREHVVIQWYRRDAASGDWYVLTDISGTRKQGWVEIYSSTRANQFFGVGQMLASYALRCLGAGEEYKVEVYVDGRLAAEASETVALGAGGSSSAPAIDRPIGARDLGVAFCVPSDWQQTLDEPGLAVGYEDTEFTAGHRGVLAFRVQQPGPPLPADSCPDEARTQAAISEVLAATGFDAALPVLEHLSDDPIKGFLSWRCMVNAYYYTPDANANPNDLQYAYVRAAPNADGSVTVVVVLGPFSDFKAEGSGFGRLLIQTLLPYR